MDNIEHIPIIKFTKNDKVYTYYDEFMDFIYIQNDLLKSLKDISQIVKDMKEPPSKHMYIFKLIQKSIYKLLNILKD